MSSMQASRRYEAGKRSRSNRPGVGEEAEKRSRRERAQTQWPNGISPLAQELSDRLYHELVDTGTVQEPVRPWSTHLQVRKRDGALFVYPLVDCTEDTAAPAAAPEAAAAPRPLLEPVPAAQPKPWDDHDEFWADWRRDNNLDALATAPRSPIATAATAPNSPKTPKGCENDSPASKALAKMIV